MKFKPRSYGLRWHLINSSMRSAGSIRSRREYVIEKKHVPGFQYYEYFLWVRRSPLHELEVLASFDRLCLAHDAADRCEWARWEA